MQFLFDFFYQKIEDYKKCQDSKLMAEIGLYAEDGANIMIEKGWLEEPPQEVDSKALV